MFGNNNSNSNGNNDGGNSQADEVRRTLAGMNLGFRTEGIPQGVGTFELDRVYTDVSKGKRSGVPLFRARLVCVQHENPMHVGKTFIWTNALTGKPLNIILEQQTKFLVLLFGIAAKAQINSAECKDAICNAHVDNYKSIVETQKFYGQDLKGRKIRGTGIPNVSPKDGKTYINAYFDAADS